MDYIIFIFILIMVIYSIILTELLTLKAIELYDGNYYCGFGSCSICSVLYW